jgi:hypothetical protein
MASLAIIAGACSSGSSRTSPSSSAGPGGLSCKIGGGCSQTQTCTGGIEGCTSNCNCLNGTWQAPCPADLPETGSPCSPESAYCGYTTSTNPCGADNCDCQGGAWSCGPTCVLFPAEDASSDAADQHAPGVACTSVGDCTNTALGTAWCCLDHACAYSPGTPLIACTDADVQLIEASNYDQSCTTDSDCVAVREGNFCFPPICPSAAINVSAEARYNEDVAMTNAAICGGIASCPSFAGTFCCAGSCRLSPCAADAGAGGDTGSSDAGPSDAPAGG